MNYPEQFLSSQIQQSEQHKKKRDQIQIIRTSYVKINSRVAYTTKLFLNKFWI